MDGTGIAIEGRRMKEGRAKNDGKSVGKREEREGGKGVRRRRKEKERGGKKPVSSGK